jgi:hypothetical protein
MNNTQETEDFASIPLSRGMEALIDRWDFDYLNQWVWFAARFRDKTYAARNEKDRNGRKYLVLMHREVLGLKRGDPRKGDHRDRSRTLDNRRSNLRIATSSQNAANSKRPSSNSTGFKGVSYLPALGKWGAHVKSGGKQKHLGLFETAELAHLAYCDAATSAFGQFARFA